MNVANTAEEMRAWFTTRELMWAQQRVVAKLRLSNNLDMNKAVTTLETVSFLGSVTAWGTGTVEFIVLNTKTGTEVIARDSEYTTENELRQLLNDCADEFERIIR